MNSWTKRLSRLAHFVDKQTSKHFKFNFRLGKIYDADPVFWNDGAVGLIFGVPITWLLYSLTFQQIPNGLAQFLGYIACALLAFCLQHLLRRKWVFK